jgi:formyl-CoA transferase
MSMLESTTSWLTVPVTMTCSFGKKISRRGNTHEFFAPVSVYPTSDGFVYIAVGNDKQFQAIASLLEFSALDREEYRKNAGRIADVANLNGTIAGISSTMTTQALVETMNRIGVAAAKINAISEVVQDSLVTNNLLKATDEKTGFELTLAPPPYSTPFLEANGRRLSFPPRFGEHNHAILGKRLGLSSDELAALKADGVV